MLGHKMFQVLSARFPFTRCTVKGRIEGSPLQAVPLYRRGEVIEHFDVTDWDRAASELRHLAPRTVVNCVGVIKQRREAQEYVPSILVNSLFPHRIAQLAGEWGGRLIHFSTDCVFSGSKGNYTESDVPDASDIYGRTKALGEVVAGNALTLRTSIVGRELTFHQSLLEWFLSQQGRTVRGFRRVLYSGVTTNYLSALVADIVARHRALTGLYHVAGDTISKHDLLCLLREAYGLNVSIVPDDEEVCDRSLCGDRLVAATGVRTPSWRQLVAQLVEDPTPYAEWTRGSETTPPLS